MKKLFAIVAVMGVLTFGSTQLAQAQDAPAAEQTEQAAVAPAADATAPAAMEATEGGIHKELKTKFIEGTASFMSLVAIALVIGLAFCIERIIYLSLAEINTKKFLAAIEAALENDETLSKDQKVLAIQKELEEATALELPMMEQNLPIIGTITTLGTLMGLLGTVIGMIRSFAALSAGGGTDSMALSQGISEALINTAFGILTGALAVIAYNYYTNKIDKLTYSLDEVGFSIVQTFAASHK